MNEANGILFSDELQAQIKARFHHVDRDADGRERLFLDNAGGSFRLKAAITRLAAIDALPDCPERLHERAVFLQSIQAQGCADLRLMLNADGGAIYASLTASGAMFEMVRAVAENVPGKNMVTTVLEHPSSYDAMALYAARTGRELRVARSNPVTGGVDAEEIARLIDADTVLLSVMYASNISGAKLDIERIVQCTRQIKPGLHILVDAVQHAPHGLIDLSKTPIDGLNIAPYKFFGCRGSGFSWISERTARLAHHQLAGKPEGVWDLGSPAPWQFGVLSEIVDYVCWLGGHFTTSTERRDLFVTGIERIALHERALLERMLDGTEDVPGLRSIEGVDVFLDCADLSKRDLIVAMGIRGLGYTQAVREFESRAVIVYERVASSLYSKRMLDSFGLEGAIRVSPLHCHGAADIDRFLRITRELAETFSPVGAQPR
jgi:cysteine desulfurase / selenocysteine lyase